MHLNLILDNSNFIEMHGHTYLSFKSKGRYFFFCYVLIYYCACTHTVFCFFFGSFFWQLGDVTPMVQVMS